MKFPSFINGSYPTGVALADSEDTINFLVERMESPGARNQQILRPTPGFTPFATVADVGFRGGIYADSRCFMAFGPTIYEVFHDGTTTSRGTVTQDSRPATFSYNGVAGGQIFISSGTNGYCLTLSDNSFSQVLTGEATMGAFSSGFFLAFNLTNGKVRLSKLQDGTSWPSTVFFQRSYFPDPWQAMFTDNQGLVWLPGTNTFEVWSNQGGSPQPFALLQGQVGRYGIASPFGWALAGQQIFWLARNPEGSAVVLAPQEGGGTAVSNYAVAQDLAAFERTAAISDAEAFSYQQDGHTFFILHLPSGPRTWAFDADQPRAFTETARLSTGAWAKRGRWNPMLTRFDLWSPRGHVYAFGKHLIGDRTSGVIAEMTPTVATELDGAGIRRVRQSPLVGDEFQRFAIDQFQLVVDPGLGLQSGQGQTPLAMLQTSRDGGRTWGNERIASVGRVGQYARRVYWTRLGLFDLGMVRVSMTDPIPWRITDAYLNNLERAA